MHAEKFQSFFLNLYFGKSQLMIVICDVSLALLAVFCSPDHLTWGFVGTGVNYYNRTPIDKSNKIILNTDLTHIIVKHLLSQR